MDEKMPTLPAELEAAMNDFYSSAQPDEAFAKRLETQIRARQIELVRSHPRSWKTGRTFMHTLRTRPVLLVITVILALLLLSGVAYAVAQWAGFIPGIGFVKDVRSVMEKTVAVERAVFPTPGERSVTPESVSTTQTREKVPVSQVDGSTVLKRDGIVLTVEQVVSTADKLVIVYKLNGLPNLFAPERAQTEMAYSEAHPNEPMPEQVRLPDGTLLDHSDGGGCSGGSDVATSWLECRSNYARLPDGVTEFTLEIHRLQNALPGELPEDWQIPIRLTPVSAAQSGGGVHGVHGVQEPNLRSQTVNGITLELLKVSQTPAQTAFQLGVEWEGQNRIVQHTAAVTLQDRQGRYYILGSGPDGGSFSADHPNFSTLPSLVTTPVDGHEPLTFRLEWMVLSATSQGSLHFDPGKDAKVGQEWTINDAVQTGGFDLNFTKARLKGASDGSVMLEFDIQAPEGVSGVTLFADGSNSSEGGTDLRRGILVGGISLPAVPTQPIDVDIAEVDYRVKGPWDIQWQPEVMDLSGAATATPPAVRTAGPEATLVPGVPLLAELQGLLKQNATKASRAGWVHQTMVMDVAEEIGTLDTGDLPVQPLQTREEAWYQVDENGNAKTTIYIMKSMDGKTLSVDIHQGVYRFRLPQAQGGIDADVYLEKPAYDLGLLGILNGYLAQGGTLRKEAAVMDGVACQRYEATQSFNPAMVMQGEPAAVRAMRTSGCVDAASGKVIEVQTEMVYTDGTSRVHDSTRFVSIEEVDRLPDDEQQILDQIVMP